MASVNQYGQGGLPPFLTKPTTPDQFKGRSLKGVVNAILENTLGTNIDYMAWAFTHPGGRLRQGGLGSVPYGPGFKPKFKGPEQAQLFNDWLARNEKFNRQAGKDRRNMSQDALTDAFIDMMGVPLPDFRGPHQQVAQMLGRPTGPKRYSSVNEILGMDNPFVSRSGGAHGPEMAKYYYSMLHSNPNFRGAIAPVARAALVHSLLRQPGMIRPHK